MDLTNKTDVAENTFALSTETSTSLHVRAAGNPEHSAKQQDDKKQLDTL